MGRKAKKRRADHGMSKEEYKLEKEVTIFLRRFSKYLTERREHDNLTLRVIGERAHIPHSSVYQIEQSNKDPRLSELMKLAQAFNESVHQFLVPFLQGPPGAAAESGERKENFAEIPMSRSQGEIPRQSDALGLEPEQKEPAVGDRGLGFVTNDLRNTAEEE